MSPRARAKATTPKRRRKRKLSKAGASFIAAFLLEDAAAAWVY